MFMKKTKTMPPPSAETSHTAVGLWAERLEQINLAMDPFGIGASFKEVSQGWMAHPHKLTTELASLSRDLQALQLHAWQTATGLQPKPVVKPKADDERFSDPIWSDAPAFSLLKQYYLLYTHWLEDVLFDAPGTSAEERRRAAFWARQWLNAFAPTNSLFTNPVALRKYYETGGESLTKGLKLWLDDLRTGDVQMVDRSAFQVGQNLATTPGAVVYRNELMELIQYTPTTPKVHAVPIVIVPPWINKYYILDLNEKKSLLRYLVGQGYTVFVVSWKNPGTAQADTTFDDYLMQGIREAVDAARAICKTPQVHAVGYCIGGTALAALMAWYNAEYPDAKQVPVAHWTLLASLVDFSRPGAIEAFLNEKTINSLDKMMAQQGYLDGRDMARAFRMLRSNSLIWQYFVHNYLYGETPPAFDVLYWNTDVTRMPRVMHSYYLREFYLHNKLIQKNGLNLAGHAIDLRLIRQPLHAVGCEEDHIAPWKATFKIASHIAAPVTYTLSSSGHILGIINPPVKPPKRRYWSGPCNAKTADEWHKQQDEVSGSWWEHWNQRLAKQCGPLVAARAPGSAKYPVLGPAPGLYVHEV
jgi:polyhydroxyalkanoate synthase